ncbi:amidohydrolase [Coniella lustricola]|uniref:Amidohydrolase n=1 Tax=Coniella lustricola TaxID=2025994 RepID=A0A2T2ZUM8_9PEZI|nr:amidohydrolase [Coniella lustricola]
MVTEADLKPWLRPSPYQYILTNANVVDVVNGIILPNKTVTLRDGFIHSITDTGNATAPSNAEEAALRDTTSEATVSTVTIDCRNHYLTPGLIDCHVHLMAVPGFSSLASAFGNPNDVSVLRQPYVCAQMLHRGFTSVRDCGGALLALKEAVADGVFPGPRLFIAGHALSQSGGHADYRSAHDHSFCCGGTTTGLGRIANGVPQCMQAVREEIRAGADFIKVMGSGGVSSPTDRIDHLQFTGAELRAMAECAANAGTYMTAHAYTARAIRHCIDNGARGIEHGNFLDAPTARLMAERGCFLTPTLVTYAEMASARWRGYLPPESASKNTEVLDAGLKALRTAHEAGVTICYGTDLLGPLGQAQTHEFALRAQVLPSLEVLRSATVNAARLLMREEELGQVRAGFAADVLLVRANPLEDVTVFDDPERNVALVIKEGRVCKSRWEGVVEDGVTGVQIKSSL